MAIAEQSIVLQEKPQRLWDVLSDIKNWEFLLARTSYLRRIRFACEPLSGEQASLRFRISHKGRSLQICQVSQWEPPSRLSVSGRSPSPRLLRSESSLGLTISPVDTLTTRADFRLEMSFTHPLLGTLINHVFLTDRRLGAILENIAQRLPRLLERAG